jgi:hypothetical protein
MRDPPVGQAVPDGDTLRRRETAFHQRFCGKSAGGRRHFRAIGHSLTYGKTKPPGAREIKNSLYPRRIQDLSLALDAA